MKKSHQNELRKKRQAKQVNRNWLQKLTDVCEGFFLDIFDVIGLWFFVDWYLKKQEAMRYLVFGGLTTIVNILVFALFDFIKFPILISNTIAWIVAVIFAFITNKYCVFDSKKHSKSEIAKEISSFVGARIFTLIVESIFLQITISWLGWNSLLMKVLSNIIVIILNFIFSKLFIFKKDGKISLENGEGEKPKKSA